MTTPKGRAAISVAAGPAEIAQRLLLAVVAGYIFSMEIAGLSGLLLAQFIARSESAALTAMLSFLLYTFVILWGFADRSLLRLWITIPGGAALAYTLSALLSQALHV